LSKEKTVQKHIKIVLKVAFCLLLCLPLLLQSRHLAAAQTSTAAPPATTPVAAPPVATPPPPVPALPADQQAAANATVPATAPMQVSIAGMVRNSDPIVQAVMAFLLLCSAASWAAFIFKSFVLASAQRNTREFSIAFRNAATMDNAEAAVKSAGDGPAQQMLAAAKQEWDATLSVTGTPLAAHQTNRLLQRLVLAMGSVQESALSRLGSWMGLLATIGSTAPFIGLFGTVWGILDSFEHISASYNTSLTVVAPGIAEALLATAVGLFTAIPATIFYNRFARESGKITGMLDNVAAELIVFASRDVERLAK
jgi:biopolymer transport protein ExbB/TolQ